MFRTFTFYEPDLLSICYGLLSGIGIADSYNLSNKLVSMFKVLKDLLSSSKKYRWGARDLCATINAVKNERIEKISSKISHPDSDYFREGLNKFYMGRISNCDKENFYRVLDSFFPL